MSTDTDVSTALPETVTRLIEEESHVRLIHDGWLAEFGVWCAELAYTAGLEAGAAQERERPTCVCGVDDGLVQEWVSKARAVAKAKGFDPAARTPPEPEEPGR